MIWANFRAILYTVSGINDIAAGNIVRSWKKMEIRVVISEDKAWGISVKLEKLWLLPRSAAQKRILMALYETGSKRYLAYEGTQLLAAMAVKKRWSRYHILQMGSIVKGNGTSLVKSIIHLPLEVVATNFSKGFWIKMGFHKKEGPYHNVFVNNEAPCQCNKLYN